MSRVWLLVLVCVVGCVKPGDVECGGGIVCPGGTVCATLTEPDEHVCVQQEQLDKCQGKAENDDCTDDGEPPSSCQDGVCVLVVCGNKRVDRGEACDDGNTVTGDGALPDGGCSQPRGGHVMSRTFDGSGVLAIAGQIGDASTGATNDVWRLRYENQQPREICAFATDNDGDGKTGCEDQDCWAQCTPLCPPGASCDMTAPRCGDGVCNAALENCRICPGDCACTAACGDTFCDAPESMASCPGDCTP